MLKKMYNIIKYLVLIGLILVFVDDVYIRDLRGVCEGIFFIIFWITMMIREKSSKENRFISIAYYTACFMILTFTFLKVFFAISI